MADRNLGNVLVNLAGDTPDEMERRAIAANAALERLRQLRAQQQQQRPPLITDYLGQSAAQMRRGAHEIATAPKIEAHDPYTARSALSNQLAQGTSDVVRGASPFLLPLAPLGAAAPLATLAGLVGGGLAGWGTEKLATKAGVSPGVAALAGDVAGFTAGAGAGELAGRVGPEEIERFLRAYEESPFSSERGAVTINLKRKAPRVENAAGAQVRGTMGGAKGKTYIPLADDVDALAQKLQPDNPEAGKRTATAMLKWRNWEKPEIEAKYGPLVRSAPTDTKLERMQNTPERVGERIQESQAFLAQPTERWTPKDYGIFDRSLIRQAMNGFPGVEQTEFPRAQPTRASLAHVDEIYNDRVNRALIKTQIARGLPLGGETFYASLYPVKAEAIARNLRSDYFPQTGGDLFDHWIHSVAPGSARNSILNERAVGNLLRNMKARGISLTEENVAREMARFAKRYGTGLPLMPVHRQGAARVLEQGISPLEVLKGNLTDSYKIPTYSVQQTGNFAHSWTGDVHEATGETLGSRFHPYFTKQGGFGVNEYGRAEQYMRDIAKEMGVPTGSAQAGRWFGGGELTGLKSPRGDSLDMLETQVAYTLHEMGQPTTPQAIRDYVMKLIQEGGDLLPWAKKEPMPDYRQRR